MTFQEIYEEVQSLTGDNSTASTTKHKARINRTYKKLLRKFNYRTETTATTVASTQSYELPQNIVKLTSVKVTVSSIDYPLEEIVNENDWNNINSQGVAFTSDTQTNYYIKDNNILLYPTPASSGNTITYYYTATDKDMSVDSTATSSTIKTLANTGTTVTSNAAAFTSAMVGRYIKIDSDGYWYKIAGYTSTTVITIEEPYMGTAISAGTEAFTVAEIPLLPEQYHLAIVYEPCMLYFLSQQDSGKLSATYKALYNEVVENMNIENDVSSSNIIKNTISDIRNPNDYPKI